MFLANPFAPFFCQAMKSPAEQLQLLTRGTAQIISEKERLMGLSLTMALLGCLGEITN